MPSDNVMAKLDFTDAFNLHRRDILSTVASVLPEIYAYCYSAYSSFSYLFHGSYTVMSQEGVQQGGPLGHLCCYSVPSSHFWNFLLVPY